MSFSFGQGINPQLGAIDYSPILRGAQSAAQSILAGGQAMGQGISNALSSVGQGVKDYYKKKEENEKINFAAETISPMLKNENVRNALGIPQGASDDVVNKYLVKAIKGFGAENAYNMVSKLRENVAFSEAMSGVPQTVTETKVTDFKNIAPAPTATSFANEGLGIEYGATGGAKKSWETDQAGVLKRIQEKPVAVTKPAVAPKNLSQFFFTNSSTGQIEPRQSFIDATLASTQNIKSLIELKNKNDELLKKGEYTSSRLAHMAFPFSFALNAATPLTQKLNQTEKEQLSIQNSNLDEKIAGEIAKLSSYNQARIDAANFNNEKQVTTFEKRASSIIDDSIKLADQVNLNPVEKKQWVQMKDIINEIPRKATDEEKVASFVQKYSEIAPIDAGLYMKMKEVFNTTPVITDIGDGYRIVSVKDKTFVIDPAKQTTVPIANVKYGDNLNMARMLNYAKQAGGLNNIPEDVKNSMEILNSQNPRINQFSGAPMSLEELYNSFYPSDKSSSQSNQPKLGSNLSGWSIR